MRIEELSIGDWVCAKLAKWESDDADMTPPLQVKAIYDIERQILYVDLFNPANNTIEHSAFVEDLIPIPLTPEILEKNGLEYEDEGNDAIVFLCCDVFWARLCVGDTFWQVGIHSEDRLDAVVCNVKYTHQLQHALRLAGIEKEIEV